MNPVRNLPQRNNGTGNKEMIMLNKFILVTARKNNFSELFFAEGF